MVSGDDKQKNLDLATRFLGWGDPRNPIWFVALEEGQLFDTKHLDKLRAWQQQFADEVHNSLDSFWETYEIKQRYGLPDVGEMHAAEEWIINQLRLGDSVAADPGSDSRSGFWRYAFHCNLYPLGHQRGNPFPAKDYGALFGVTSTSDDVFCEASKKRFGWIKRLIQESTKAIICFGLDSQSEFEDVFGTQTSERKLGHRTRGVVLGKKTIVVAHASGRHSRPLFQDAKQDLVALLRDDWKVSLG
jgi:hypothetical protein